MDDAEAKRLARNAANRRWRVKNPDKVKAINKRWREKHPAEAAEKWRKWCLRKSQIVKPISMSPAGKVKWEMELFRWRRRNRAGI
jgi:hypothetical protein